MLIATRSVQSVRIQPKIPNLVKTAKNRFVEVPVCIGFAIFLEAMAILRERKKGFQEKLSELNEERKAQLGDFSEVMTEREEKSKKIQTLIQDKYVFY